MGRGESIAFPILQQAHEHAGTIRFDPVPSPLVIASESRLHGLPEFLRNNGIVLTGVFLVSMANLPSVDVALQNLIKGTPGERTSARTVPGRADPLFAPDSLLVQVFLELRNSAHLQVGTIDIVDEASLLLVHD